MEVSLAQLCRALPGVLLPVTPKPAPPLPLSAVHVSEMPDPSPYLEGGELLLTNGLSLEPSPEACAAYVATLTRRRVAALVLGLGPRFDDVPGALLDACAEYGLPLLEVPEPEPFHRISRAFWQQFGKVVHQRGAEVASAHRRLVRAASRAEPVPAILRTLASAVNGWAAVLDRRFTLTDLWPQESTAAIEKARVEASRLDLEPATSSASLTLAEERVVLLPLVVGDSTYGALMSGTGQAGLADEQHIFHTASMLLSMAAHQAHQRALTRYRAGESVAALLERGHHEAAGDLARHLDMPMPDDPVNVLVIDGCDVLDAATAVRRAWPDYDSIALGAVAERRSWFLISSLPRDETILTRLRDVLLSLAGPSVRAILAPPSRTESACRIRNTVIKKLGEVLPGTVRDFHERPGPYAAKIDAWAAFELTVPLREPRNTPVAEALVAYLRFQGSWEAASRHLKIHRNTLRYRVARAEKLLQVDMNDPDHRAQLWLALREIGLAAR